MNFNNTNDSRIVLNDNLNLQYDFNDLSHDECARVSDRNAVAIAAENNNDNKSSENGDFSEIFGNLIWLIITLIFLWFSLIKLFCCLLYEF